MNILVTGSNGQLGSEIKQIAQTEKSFQFFFTDVAELDITDIDAINTFCQENKINVIVNCAAYTAVDKAEDEPEMALLINATAVKNLAEAAKQNGAKLIHVSTDYVFDGTACTPYATDASTSPTSVYGNTKLKGEQMAMEALADAIIIRTSWLYSVYGNNFVKTMMRLGQERDSLNVVFDQIGSPTNAACLADAIIEIIRQNCKVSGVFHFSNEGVCSWYDFAYSIMKKRNITCSLFPVDSSGFPTKATRPHYSVMDKKRIKESYNINIPHWEEALHACLEKL